MNRTNTVLVVLLVVVVVMTAGVGVDYSQPNIEILPDMKYTPAWEAFAANPNFADGRTMQPPVPGTIARGQLPLYFDATKEDAVRAGEELVNPVGRSAIEAAVEAELESDASTDSGALESGSATEDVDEASSAASAAGSQHLNAEAIASERFAASIERGSKVYLTFCISCHGPKGAGDGLVPQRGFPPPPSMLTGKSLQMKDGQLFHILTYGQGSMAPFASQLSRDLRWDVINYVRDLQSKAPAAAPVEPGEEERTPESTTGTEVPPSVLPPTEEKVDDDKAGAAEKVQNLEAPANELRNRSSERTRSDTSETNKENPVVGVPANGANGRE